MGKFGSILFNIGVAVDQLGNTLAGGYADNTISARVGYFAHETSKYKLKSLMRPYWLFLQFIINTTFHPVDGPGHCHMAYHKEAGNGFEDGSDVLRFILSLIIFASCIPISIILYTLWLLQIVRPGNPDLAKIAEKGFSKMNRMMKSEFEIVKEEDTLPDSLLTKAKDSNETMGRLVVEIGKKVKD